MRNLLLVAVWVLLSAGCASRKGEPITPPLQVASGTLAQGETLYMFHCNKCHPGGGKGLGPAIHNKPLPRFLIKAQVRAGAGAMPGFSRELISGEELEWVIDYIELLRRQ